MMNGNATESPRRNRNPWRITGWSIVAGLIALPAVAMLFTDEVAWTISDFVFAIVMLGGVGLVFEMAVRASGSRAYRGGAAMALGTGLLTVWVNGAVGIVGSENEPANLWFNLVPLLALIACFGVRFRPPGMAAAMLATAAAQVVVGVVLHVQGHVTWMFTPIATGGWLLSAFLFRRSAREG